MAMMIDVDTHKLFLGGACRLGLQELAKPMFVRDTQGPVVTIVQIFAHHLLRSLPVRIRGAKEARGRSLVQLLLKPPEGGHLW